MIQPTTREEALQMTACPACASHKGAGQLFCPQCLLTREDIVPFVLTHMTFENWLHYALYSHTLGFTKVVHIQGELLDL